MGGVAPDMDQVRFHQQLVAEETMDLKSRDWITRKDCMALAGCTLEQEGMALIYAPSSRTVCCVNKGQEGKTT